MESLLGFKPDLWDYLALACIFALIVAGLTITVFVLGLPGRIAIACKHPEAEAVTGPVADVLHGFQGRAWGAGPMALYVAKVEKPGVILQLRWVNEFKVTNLLKGNTFLFGLTLKIN